jgi:sugar phosphate isomerase/epimerase
VLKVYDRLGFSNIELGAGHKYSSDIKPVFGFDFNYTVHVVFPPPKEPFMLNIASDTEIFQRTIKTAKETLDWSRKLDAIYQGIHIGTAADFLADETTISPMISKEKQFSNMVEALSQICDKAEEVDVPIAVENLPCYKDFITYFTSEEVNRLLKEVGSKKLGLLMDLNHLQLTKEFYEFDMKKYIGTLLDKVLGFHVSEARDGDGHFFLDSTDYFSRFGLSKSALKRRVVCLEVHKLDEAGAKSQMEILQKCVDNAEAKVL